MPMEAAVTRLLCECIMHALMQHNKAITIFSKRPSSEDIVRGSDIPTMAMGRLLMSSWKMKAAQRRPDSDIAFQERAVSST